MKKYLYIIPILFFILGMINILFAWLGLICMAIPITMLFRTKKKVFCQKYCPRVDLFNQSAKLKPKKSRKTPQFLLHENAKWIVLSYFFVSLFFIIMSTIKVATGATPMLFLRYFIIFPVPFELPQLINIEAPLWMLHFGYRMYSMMMTTVTLGLLLAVIYKPRTWCTVCPINTLSNEYIKAYKTNSN